MKLRTTSIIFSLLASSSSARSFSFTQRTSAFATTTRRAFLLSLASTTMTQSNGNTNNDKGSKLWDRFAEGYSKQPIKDEEAYQKKIQVTQKYFKPTDSVVEIGCGTGGTSIIHSAYVRKILATDFSAKMLEIARQRAQEAGGKNVVFQQASVEQLELPRNSQDVVLGLSILHLLPNKEEAMRKVNSWLKPGGLFVTSTVCAGDMGASTKFLLKTIMPVAQFFGFIPNFYAFTKADLEESFRKTGFDIEYEWRPNQKEAAVFIIGKKK